jgi:type IV secretion system protein VirB10
MMAEEKQLDEAEEPAYETTAEEATGFGSEEPRFLDRKKLMIALSVVLSVVVGGGFIFNINRDKKKNAADAETMAAAARSPADFLKTQRDRALSAKPESADPGSGTEAVPDPLPGPEADPAAGLSPYRPDSRTVYVGSSPPPPPPAAAGNRTSAPASGGSRSSGGADPLQAALRSPLVPQGIEGSLFAGGQAGSRQAAAGTYQQYTGAQAQGNAAANDYLSQALAARNAMPQVSYGSPDPYTQQNAQGNKQEFYPSGSGGAIDSGGFLQDNALWIGTIVPGVLETGINTDLPGDVIARVTQNVYDSRTGGNLLIPQGTILVARYNSSVSYAQKRVQIAWDVLIRPDGFTVELGGMNAVDRRGYSGQEADYHENWFEYLKAAGIINIFSVANAKMTEEAATYASSDTAAAVAQANSQYVNQIGGNFVSRAMNIQPTLTVDSGTLINIMLNKTIYLPPVEDYGASQKYILE